MFEFGPYQLDPVTVRLTRAGTRIELEPQLFNTLLLLLENHHRVVSKQELLEKIWQGREVTSHVITHIIYELRKTLDDKQSSDSYLRTVRGNGYQFVGQVNKISTTYADFVETDSVEIKSHNSYFFVVALLFLLALSGYFWFSKVQHDAQTNVALSDLSDRYPIVAVLPIKLASGTDELSTLAESVIDYMTTQLALNLSMKVIHPDSMMTLENQFDDIWTIQNATRADFILEGFLETVSQNKIKVHLTLYKHTKSSGLTPYSLGGFEFPYPHTAKDLDDLYKQRKISVREIVNLIEPGVSVANNGGSETHDPEAYRMSIAAHHLMRNGSCKDIYRAEELLKQATTKDPQFVYAWQQLFANYFNRIWVCGDSTENYQDALEMAETVELLAPNKYKSVAIARNGILIETNQVEQAFEYVKDVDWNDPDALYRKVYALRYAGFLNLANVYIERILQLDPFYFNEKPIHQAPNTVLYLNRFDDHQALLAEPGNAYHDYYRGLNLFLNNQKDEALKILQGVVDRTPRDLFGRFSQALLALMTGQNKAAITTIDAIVILRNEKKHTDGEMTYKLAQLYALANANERALESLQTAVNQGFFPMNYFLKDPALKSIQNSTAFSLIIAQATQRHQAFADRFGLKAETMTTPIQQY